MANIDISTIRGFDGMTDAQKVEALLKFEIPEAFDKSKWIEMDKYTKLKASFDKTSSELSAAKDQIKGKMTAEEAEKAEYDQAMQEMQDKYNDLLKQSTIANHTAKFLAMPGYDEKLARETAEALFDGNMDKVFENQQKANEAYEKKLKADAMKGMKGPAKGDGDDLPENVEYAKQRGKARADALKASKDVLSHYMK